MNLCGKFEEKLGEIEREGGRNKESCEKRERERERKMEGERCRERERELHTLL